MIFWKLRYWIKHKIFKKPTVRYYRHFTRSGELKIYIQPSLNKVEKHINREFSHKSAPSKKNLTKLLFRFLKERKIYRTFIQRWYFELTLRGIHEDKMFDYISLNRFNDIFGFFQYSYIDDDELNNIWNKYRIEWIKLIQSLY